MIKITFLFTLLLHLSISIEVPKWRMNDGHEIPSLALGTWLGKNENGVSNLPKPETNEVQTAVEWAIDAGYRHIDTAAIYLTEPQVGKGVQNKIKDGVVNREDLFVTTKLWNSKHAPSDVLPALKESLKQLNLSYVDLYLIHWPISQYENKTYYEVDYVDTWKEMMKAKELGFTKSIGLSNFNEEQITRIIDSGLVKPAVLEVEINLNLQQPSLLEFCKKQNIIVLGYTPFGSLFSNKLNGNGTKANDPELQKMSQKYNKTVGQIAVKYLYDIGVIPLPKSITKSRIEENINIFDFEISKEDKETLKSYDKNYRTLPQYKWKDISYYPFKS